jgi:hypothetical protein
MAGAWYDVEPKQQDLNDRNAVEVDKQIPEGLERTLLMTRLEERAVSVDAVEKHELRCCVGGMSTRRA